MSKPDIFLDSIDVAADGAILSEKIKNQNLKISDQNAKISELEKTTEKILNKDNETLQRRGVFKVKTETQPAQEEFSRSKQLLSAETQPAETQQAQKEFSKSKQLSVETQPAQEEFSNSKQLLTSQQPNQNNLQLSRSIHASSSFPYDHVVTVSTGIQITYEIRHFLLIF